MSAQRRTNRHAGSGEMPHHGLEESRNGSNRSATPSPTGRRERGNVLRSLVKQIAMSPLLAMSAGPGGAPMTTVAEPGRAEMSEQRLVTTGAPLQATYRRIALALRGRTVDRFDPQSRLLTNGVAPAFRESYRLLALNLRSLIRDSGVGSLLVMSAYPSDGRSMTVANLALAFAEAKMDTLVIDADFRRPTLGQLFGLETAPILQDVLDRDEWHESWASPGPLPSMRVLAFSGTTVGGEALVAADRLAQLAANAKAGGRVVLIDSPACLSHSDAFHLAPRVDGVLYVVRKRAQSEAAQKEVRAQLDRLGANVVGVVYNEA